MLTRLVGFACASRELLHTIVGDGDSEIVPYVVGNDVLACVIQSNDVQTLSDEALD
jgi:hypothetical protein